MNTNQSLRTPLRYFRFNSKIQTGTFITEWFRYDLDEDVEENIRAFSNAELEQFRNYVVPNTWNFGGGKDYFTVTEGGVPIEEIYDLVPDERKMFPDCLILKPNPTLQKSLLVSPFMEIVLVDEHGLERSDYNLPFGVVGKIVARI